MEERELKLVDISSEVLSTNSYGASIEVDASSIKDATIVEYGFTSTIQGLNRPYTMLPRFKVGERIPSDKFVMECYGLTPSIDYSIRPYFKTADGSVFFGTGKLVMTIAGIKFDSENWSIEQTTLKIPFTLTDPTIVKNPKLWFGTDRSSLEKKLTLRPPAMLRTPYS